MHKKQMTKLVFICVTILSKQGIKDNFSNWQEVSTKKFTANIITNGETLLSFYDWDQGKVVQAHHFYSVS